MENKFSDKMITKSLEELRDYIINKQRYELEAIDAAIYELKRRGEHLNEIELKTTENETIRRAEESKKNPSYSWFLPEIIDEESARKAAKQGVWACFILVSLTFIFLVAAFYGENFYKVLYLSLIEIALCLIIAWRINAMSKVAAILGLYYYIISIICDFLIFGLSNVALKIIVLFGFINSLRGTNAFHKYRNNKSVQVISAP